MSNFPFGRGLVNPSDSLSAELTWLTFASPSSTILIKEFLVSVCLARLLLCELLAQVLDAVLSHSTGYSSLIVKPSSPRNVRIHFNSQGASHKAIYSASVVDSGT